jgi:hypothetical protein
MISISVVSHRQFNLIKNLLDDLERFCLGLDFELILTLNLPEPVEVDHYRYPIKIIENSKPNGFGKNHNNAFKVANGDFFCVVNPDVRLTSNVFVGLLGFHLANNPGISAPVVTNSNGDIEDSARRFPSPVGILSKALGIYTLAKIRHRPLQIQPDWVAGMFMLFKSSEYKGIGGFDERYFLYYEDVDICARLKLKGRPVLVCPTATVIHDSQRTSHKNLKYLRWHITSMLRFFFSINYLRLLCL